MSIFKDYQYQKLVTDVKNLIHLTKQKPGNISPKELPVYHWQIGRKIEREKLADHQGNYYNILRNLAKETNVDESSLRRSVTFFKTYPMGFGKTDDLLSWSHYKSLITIKDENLRTELEKKAKKEKWGRNKLIEAIKMQKNGELKISEGILVRPENPDYIFKAKITKIIDPISFLLNIDLGFRLIKEQKVKLRALELTNDKEQQEEALKYVTKLTAKLDHILVKTSKMEVNGRILVDMFVNNCNESSISQIFKKGLYVNESLLANNFSRLI